jgi:type VI protein secretion system component VasK
MSFFGYTILFMAALLVLAVWVWSIVQIVARPDFRVWAKVVWIAAVLVFPIVGTIVYLIYSSKRGPIDETKKWEDMSAEEIEEAEYRASHMTATDRSGDQRIF